ncbi:tRNA-dihydrouridine synthase 3 [Metarhizium acridum]|nr:tRNA-dihydrouridine synthase 3 [Metarhizium acridum]
MNGQEQTPAPAPAPETTHHEPDTPEQPAAKRLKVDDAAHSGAGSNASEETNGQESRDVPTNGNGETVAEPSAPVARRAGVTPIKKE